jgi:hypothetical protein
VAIAQETAGKRPRWLLWLHRIGYVTTALVVAQLLAFAFYGTRAWLEERKADAEQIEETRTHEGPLQPTDDRWVRGNAIYLLEKLPPLRELGGNGIRFVAMPSFNRSRFAVAIYLPEPAADEAQGVLMRFDQENEYAPLGKRQFRVPATAYRSLVANMDKVTDGWPGHPIYCLDGTTIAFERVRRRRITSGIGHCHQHYEQIGTLMWNYLRRFAPGDDLPARGDWHETDQ